MTSRLPHVADTGIVPEGERRAVERAQRAMKRFGFEITTIRREPGSMRYWQVHWRVNDNDLVTADFGVSGETASGAARTALVNAVSSLRV